MFSEPKKLSSLLLKVITVPLLFPCISSLEFMVISLPHPLECWGYRQVPTNMDPTNYFCLGISDQYHVNYIPYCQQSNSEHFNNMSLTCVLSLPHNVIILIQSFPQQFSTHNLHSHNYNSSPPINMNPVMKEFKNMAKVN